MNRNVHWISFLMVLALPLTLFAQGRISGTVTDAATGDPLAGANVVVEGTSLGAAANTDGSFAIENVPMGSFTVTASMIGYASASQMVNVTGAVTVNFALEVSAYQLSTLEVLAGRVTPEAPVAFTDVKKEEMALRLGSRDIPLVLNTTPSVYATAQGGGAGDARVNVRGFNQRNVAIMINGVPVNDMENAWVYWSNWDGVGDATSSIQVQRGLSAVNLATPSVGGTMNIITDPAAKELGGMFKQEIGEWGFKKTTLSLHSGLIGNKLALSGTVVRKTADGFYGGTWTDAWAYYIGASLQLTKNDKFEFFALGAPQRHGQNLYRQNIGTMNRAFAENLPDYDPQALYTMVIDDDGDTTYYGKYKEQGRDFNQNWAPVETSYDGKQYWEMYTKKEDADRHETDILNERENFFHKPQVNLNWYHTFNDKMSLSSVLYWSGGRGGGTGTYGKIYRRDANGKLGDDDWKFYYGPSPWVYDWNQTIAMNSSLADTFYVDKSELVKENGQSLGILRNSVNQQWTVGLISKINYDVSENLKTTFGIDWRTAEIGHWREVRDLLGGEYYVFTGNDFDVVYKDTTINDTLYEIVNEAATKENQKKQLGERIAYYNVNTVDWFGFYGQANYRNGPLSAYGTFGFSTISYTYTDHFVKDEETGKPLYSENKNISGTQFKGGVQYQLSEDLAVYGNFGNISKVPIFDFAISDYDGTVYLNPENEQFKSEEYGFNLGAPASPFKAKFNYYNTTWLNRSRVRGYTNEDGSEGFIYLKGMDASHTGYEVEIAFQPSNFYRIDFAGSFGNWYMLDDVTGDVKTYYWDDTIQDYVDTLETYAYYVKDLKVGDAPQTQYSASFSLFPIPGLTMQAVYKYYDRYYADWNPFDRTDPTDRTPSWKIPAYGVMDLHFQYNLPIGSLRLQLFAHFFNVLDETYIQDATDNSQYNAWDKDHDADDAEVFFGLPKSMNAGLSILF